MIIFDRENELRDLEILYKNCLSRGIGCGVIVYGWRRIGKTTLLREFVRRVNGVYINCIWISDPYVFLRLILDFLPNDLRVKYKYFLDENDPMFVLRKAFDALLSLAEKTDRKAIVLDEFHIFVEKISTRISREKGMKKELVLDDVLGLLKDVIEAKKAFWILSTSMGWEKVRETIVRPRKAESPLIAVLKKYMVKPFDKDTSIEFIRRINSTIPMSDCELIYSLSGGVPKILEVLASSYKEGEPVLDIATRLIREGEFDDFFENVIKFVAEVSKRDYTLLVQVLKTLGLDEKTTNEIASSLRMDVDSAYVLVEELVKCDIVEKRKIGRRALYKIKYPLLPLWIELKVPPERDVCSVMARKLGIALESYISELLREYAKRGAEVIIWDDTGGTFLYGSAQEIRFTPVEILKPKNAKKKYGIQKDFDLLIITKKKPIIVEIKLDWSGLNKTDINRISRIARRINGQGLIIIEKGKPKLPLITHAVRNSIVIMSGEAIRLLAKKIKFPHW